MRIRTRLVSLFLFLILLLIAGNIATGSYGFILVDFWFNAGILMLLFASLIDQPFYSKDADVLLNGVASGVSLLAIPSPKREFIWWAFLAISVYLILSSYALMYVKSKTSFRNTAVVPSLSRVNRTIGSPKALFSALFLWGVVLQFGISGFTSSTLFFYWALFLAFDFVGLSGLLEKLLYRDALASASSIGTVRKLIEPGILEVELQSEASLNKGASVKIGATQTQPVAEGTLIDDTPVLGHRIARIMLTKTDPNWVSRLSKPDARLSIFTADRVPKDALQERFVGVVDTGSDILSLRTSTHPHVSLKQGELLWTWLDEHQRAYYQIVSGKVHEKTISDGGLIKSVIAEAQQLGIWDPKLGRFEPITWVAKANSPVYKSLDADLPETTIDQMQRGQVGSIPNSRFPVHVGLQDIVTHNTAIVGVTGSGKSWLAFGLIESLIRAKIKVLVLDMSRQYWVYLTAHNPTAIKSPTDLAPWIDSPDSYLGIYQFADVKGSIPEATAKFVEAAFIKISSAVKLKAGVDVPARLCVVIEEAHSLIPEWNQVSLEGDKNHVNKTARILLQGRKYGLGALVVTQRTANVTKTILNQCNTIFALQSFDQTGLDFLRNYMGEGYAQSISTLPVRHCVLVGKSSSSTRPVIFQIADMSTKWQTQTDSPIGGGETIAPNGGRKEAGATNA